MTRTKADAAANPRAGERWRKGNNGRTVTWRRGAMVESHTDCAPKMQQFEWLHEFSAWCQDAEFLGGTDEA